MSVDECTESKAVFPAARQSRREEQELGLMERHWRQRQGAALAHMLAWNLGPGAPGTSLAPPPSDAVAPSLGVLISLLGSAEDCHPLTSLASIYGFRLHLAGDCLPAALLLRWSVLCWENQQGPREDAPPTTGPLPPQGLVGLASSSLSPPSPWSRPNRRHQDGPP